MLPTASLFSTSIRDRSEIWIRRRIHGKIKMLDELLKIPDYKNCRESDQYIDLTAGKPSYWNESDSVGID